MLPYANIGNQTYDYEVIEFKCEHCCKLVKQQLSHFYPEWMLAKIRNVHVDCMKSIKNKV